ncbi:hypothetical protein LOK49_Contig253G00002 [Camellia lanceoleosa]|nr:hypothetical protein LOK49_Contig253G00002 [Camellia lanceoleosa]
MPPNPKEKEIERETEARQRRSADEEEEKDWRGHIQPGRGRNGGKAATPTAAKQRHHFVDGVRTQQRRRLGLRLLQSTSTVAPTVDGGGLGTLR